jgi:predicted ATPase/class 3 adenylate cyclase
MVDSGASSSSSPTFLFTDIEGSTALWERESDAMAEALAMHDLLLRAAISDFGGFAFKHTGDGLCAWFASPGAALRASLTAQQALADHTWPTSEPIKARMGVHTGPAHRVGDDFFGPTLNRTARVMSAGHGGQTLVSDETVASAGPGDDFELVSLGRHRLRDLGEPLEVFQLCRRGETPLHPPIRTLDAFPNNLRATRGGFVGRHDELLELEQLLRDHRLVTVVGPGGVGKTRLVTHAAAELLPHFADGVWVVDLARVSDPEHVSSEVVDALGLTVEGIRSPMATIAGFLADRRSLLVFDNCEHLIDPVAAAVDELVDAAADLRILATSREPLHLVSEHLMPLSPLPVETEATELFFDRAVAGGAALDDSDATRLVVETICRRLDGLPLAVELAAARARSMSVEEVNQRLDQRFRLLTGGARTAVARQRTLEATVAWGYDQLDDSTRQLFDTVAVFVGGFDLAAATAVAGGDELETLDGLEQLVDRSMITATVTEGTTRYGLLETLRQFGRDRSLESGSSEEIRNRHLTWLDELTSQLSDAVQLAEPSSMQRIDLEIGNIRAGLEWAASEPGLAVTGLSVVTNLGRYWFTRTLLAEGAQWIQRLHATAGDLDPSLAAQANCYLGFFLMEAGATQEALDPLQESIASARALGDQALLTQTLHYLSRAGYDRLPANEVIELIDEGLAIATAIDDPVHQYTHSIFRLMWHIERSDPDRARAYSADFYRHFADHPSPHFSGHAHEITAWTLIQHGDHATAQRRLRTAFHRYRQVGNVGCGCHALETLAWWLAAQDRHDDASRLLGDTQIVRMRYGHSRAPYETYGYNEARTLLQGRDPSTRQSLQLGEFDTMIDTALELLG